MERKKSGRGSLCTLYCAALLRWARNVAEDISHSLGFVAQVYQHSADDLTENRGNASM